MYCDVTLTRQEFSSLHNALCSLDSVDNPTVTNLVAQMRAALAGAYEQDNAAFDRKFVHYRSVAEELGLTAIWSMYEVDNLSDSYPYEAVKSVTYRDHWGDQPVVVPVNGLTWAALFVAADAAIRDSGDQHHVFIEQFVQQGDTLLLTTGS
jgi:hypothetical protein